MVEAIELMGEIILAGYIFSINDITSMEEAIEKGVYSTIMNLPSNPHWKIHHEGTFADYMTMKKGDNIYFFNNRKIYGVGELLEVQSDCKLLNFPESDKPFENDYNFMKDEMILNTSSSCLNNRMLCTFSGSPAFFKDGVDMDEVLASNPRSFRMLRAFWKLSFIKIDHQENKALIDIILKTNEEYIRALDNVYNESLIVKTRIEAIANTSYEVKSENILQACSELTGFIRHEMALEVGVLDYIHNEKTDVFGKWDYLTHQVVASPFKPIEYMDKMDVFGYRFIKGFETISKYLVIEIKKGMADADAVNQVMKYVDWVNQEYSFGDYNMIEAFIVAKDFPPEVVDFRDRVQSRRFVKGTRPAISMDWRNLRLISYHFDVDRNVLTFKEV